jgi:peptidyl-tRNA hydrolase
MLGLAAFYFVVGFAVAFLLQWLALKRKAGASTAHSAPQETRSEEGEVAEVWDVTEIEGGRVQCFVPQDEPAWIKGKQQASEGKMVMCVRTDVTFSKQEVATFCAHGVLSAFRALPSISSSLFQRYIRQWERYGQKKVTLKITGPELYVILTRPTRSCPLTSTARRWSPLAVPSPSPRVL